MHDRIIFNTTYNIQSSLAIISFVPACMHVHFNSNLLSAAFIVLTPVCSVIVDLSPSIYLFFTWVSFFVYLCVSCTFSVGSGFDSELLVQRLTGRTYL